MFKFNVIKKNEIYERYNLIYKSLPYQFINFYKYDKFVQKYENDVKSNIFIKKEQKIYSIRFKKR